MSELADCKTRHSNPNCQMTNLCPTDVKVQGDNDVNTTKHLWVGAIAAMMSDV